jgi:hypothetical protein
MSATGKAATTAVEAAETAANSTPMTWLARIGLTARGVVYLVMGWLAVLVATGGRANVDQRGALTEVLAAPFGTVLVWLLTLGFAAYALWRLSEAAFGVTGEPRGAGPRLKSLARAIAYAALAVTSVSLLNGSRGTQAGKQGHLAATVMSQTGGRWLVAFVGLAVVAAGLVMVREGWSAKFLRYFGHLPTTLRSTVVVLGRVGTVARGIVFAVAGVLVVLAAWTATAAKAGGIDQAFKSLLAQPYGTVLVAGLGLGLIVFGVYGLAEAAWRRVTDGDPA